MQRALLAFLFLTVPFLSAQGQIVVSVGSPLTTIGSHTVDVDLSDVPANQFSAFKFTVVSSDAGVVVTAVETAGTLSGGMTFQPSTAQLPTLQGGSSATNPITTDGTLLRLVMTVAAGVTNATVTLEAVEFQLGAVPVSFTPAVPTISVTVGANAAPTAVDDAATVVVGSSVSGNVLGNDSDSDGDPLTAALDTQATNGTATVAANGDFTYTHDGGPTTGDAFTYTVSDGFGGAATGTVVLTVQNQAPVSSDVAVSTAFDTGVDVTLTATDPEGQTLTYSIVAQPTPSGTLSAVSGSSVTFTPASGFQGTATFTFKANDGLNDSNTATVTVTVNPPNQVPVPGNDSASVPVGGTVTGNVLANDTDGDGDALTAVKATDPSSGSATVGTDGAFSYTHDGSATTSDSFTYTVSDGNGGSATGTVSITIQNQAPTANAVGVTTNFETAVQVTMDATDPEGQTLTYSIVANPGSGTLSTVSGAAVTYTPAAGFDGDDTFTYRANDGLNDSNTATVTITVREPNVAPVANTDAYTGSEDTPLTVAASGVLANDTDANGDALTAAVETSPDNGSLALNADGSFTYTPNANFNGADSFSYSASDGLVSSGAATVNLTITPVNDPPTADDKTTSAIAGTPKQIQLSGSDVENDPLTYALVVDAINGLVTISGSVATYTANSGFRGSDNFLYRTNDGTDNSDNATVTLTVTGNDAPVVTDDAYSVDEDGFLGVPAPGVLGNDSDADGNPMTASLVVDVQNGTLTLSADGSFLYEPDPDYFGTDSFAYQASDGLLFSQTGFVTVTVNPTGSAMVQVIQSVPDASVDPANVFLGGNLFLLNAPYQTSSSFVEFQDGATEVALSAGGADLGSAVATFSTVLEENKAYVLVLGGTAGSGFKLFSIPNALRDAAADRFEAFFVQGSPDLPSVDIVSVSDDLDNPREITLLAGATFGDFTSYLPNVPGPFNFAVRTAGGSDVDVFRLDLSGSGGQAYAAVVSGLLADGKVLGAYPPSMVAYGADGGKVMASVVTGIEDPLDLVPKTFLLRGNYPNPFNPTTTVQFDLPEQAQVEVRVTDLLGREVLSVPSQPMDAGTNLGIALDASELASGIYIVRIQARTARDFFVATGTMTLIK
jgi:VCBS repeat-containing protein